MLDPSGTPVPSDTPLSAKRRRTNPEETETPAQREPEQKTNGMCGKTKEETANDKKGGWATRRWRGSNRSRKCEDGEEECEECEEEIIDGEDGVAVEEDAEYD